MGINGHTNMPCTSWGSRNDKIMMDVHPERNRKEQQKKLAGGSLLRVMVINCNGIRQKHRRLRLAALMFTLRVGICIITETHLRKVEVDQLKFKNYSVVADYSRETVGRIGGGSLF